MYKVLGQHSKGHLKRAASALSELTNLKQTLSVKTELQMKTQTENSTIKNKGMQKKRVVNVLSPNRKCDTYVCFKPRRQECGWTSDFSVSIDVN